LNKKIERASLRYYNNLVKKCCKINQRGKTMIAEQSEKVKRKIKNVVNRVSGSLTKPKRKFMLEMITGMLSSQSSNLTQIARSLKEQTDIKHTSKRIHRNISKSREFLDISNVYTLHIMTIQLSHKGV
jgi:hypothetical protein